jgi:hypothetical protein
MKITNSDRTISKEVFQRQETQRQEFERFTWLDLWADELRRNSSRAMGRQKIEGKKSKDLVSTLSLLIESGLFHFLPPIFCLPLLMSFLFFESALNSVFISFQEHP